MAGESELIKRMDNGIQMLEFLKDQWPAMERITNAVQENQEFFDARCGRSCMVIAAEFIEREIRKHKAKR